MKIILPIAVGALLLSFVAGCGLRLAKTEAVDRNLTSLVEKIQESVVTVVAFDSDESVISLGSGFFVDSGGHLMTNYHVLEGAYSAIVKAYDGEKYSITSVVAENETADLIKVRVDVPQGLFQGVDVAADRPTVGERILVIGSPLGLEQTVSDGIVSAVRKIPGVGEIFQMSAPISPGSSGSPVVDMQGLVVGVVSFQAVTGQNLNFAVTGQNLAMLTPRRPILTLSQWTYRTSANVPKVTEELCKKGFQFFINGEYKEAIQFYKEATEKSPDDAEAWNGLGHCYVGLDRPGEAIAAYKEVIRTNPEDAAARYNLAAYYKQLGRFEDAIESYRQSVRIDPDHGPAYFEMGIVYGELNKLSDSKAAFKEVIRINPRHVPSHYYIGYTCARLGQKEEAIEAYKKALEIDPEHVPSLFNLGRIYGQMGRVEEESAAYRQTLRIAPDFAPAHYQMGVIYLNSGRRAAALEEYKILKGLDQDSADGLFNLIYP